MTGSDTVTLSIYLARNERSFLHQHVPVLEFVGLYVPNPASFDGAN
jgi:hypothetical protein